VCIFSSGIPSYASSQSVPLKERCAQFRQYAEKWERLHDARTAELNKFKKALEAVLVPTNFISLDAARDYISEVLGVGIYTEEKQESDPDPILFGETTPDGHLIPRKDAP